MNRTKEYNRYKMFSKALRKRNISNRVYGYDVYENLHQYSKNQIHCSCPCCSEKTKNKGHRRQKGNYNRSVNYKHSDKIKIDKLNNQINELSLKEREDDNDE